MTSPTSPPPAGWYPDPQGGDGQRWWNGAAWSNETRPAAPAAPPAPPTSPGYPGAQQDYQQQGYPGTQPGYGYGAQPGYQQQGYSGAQQGYSPYATAAPIGAWRSPADDRPFVPNIVAAARTVFSKYASFEGRAGRAEYWWWTLLNIAVFVVVYILALILILGAAGTMRSGYGAGAALSVIGSLLIMLAVVWELAVLVPSLAVLVRRLRDAGFHWGFIFLSFIPGGSIAVLVMCCLPSKYP